MLPSDRKLSFRRRSWVFKQEKGAQSKDPTSQKNGLKSKRWTVLNWSAMSPEKFCNSGEKSAEIHYYKNDNKLKELELISVGKMAETTSRQVQKASR